MTDYTDLVKRLRDNTQYFMFAQDAADAIEAQAARIEELRLLLDVAVGGPDQDKRPLLEALNKQQSAKIAELNEQLRLANIGCFNQSARIAELEARVKYLTDKCVDYAAEVGDLRAARTALEDKK